MELGVVLEVFVGCGPHVHRMIISIGSGCTGKKFYYTAPLSKGFGLGLDVPLEMNIWGLAGLSRHLPDEVRLVA